MTSHAASRPCRGRQAIQRRNARIEQYRHLVRPIALHYQQRCAEPLDDLLQVGLLGLLRAAELYRQDSGIPFAAFARPHVRGSILHYLRDHAPAVRLPRRLEEQRQQLIRLQRLQPQTTHAAALRLQLGLTEEQWQRLLAAGASRRPLPLDDLLEEESGPACTHAADEAVRDPGLDPVELLRELPDEQREVLERVVLAGWSYRRTGQALEISAMTVQRRLRRGLDQLRRHLSPGLDCRHAASAVPGC